MNIDLRCPDRAVSEYTLQTANVYVLLNQICSKRVPEHMRGNIPFNPCLLGIFLNHSSNWLLCEPLIPLVDKEIAAGFDLLFIVSIVFLEKIKYFGFSVFTIMLFWSNSRYYKSNLCFSIHGFPCRCRICVLNNRCIICDMDIDKDGETNYGGANWMWIPSSNLHWIS